MKYFTHLLNFARVILAAKFLGPFYFGIWGFLNLTIQYLSHTLLGIQYSINLELATRDESSIEKEQRLISSALFITSIVSAILLIGGIAVYLLNINIFEQYEFRKYSILVVIVVCLLHFQQLFFNIYRVYGKLYKIAFSEFIVSASVLGALFLFEGSVAIPYLFDAWILSLILSLVIFLFNSPIRLKVKRFTTESILLLKVGFPLLIYNLSYYLIIISSTTVLSFYYSVETMGYYTLANSLSNAILLGINSILWAFFPSFLAQLKEGTPDEEVKQIIYKINTIYLSAIFIIFICFLMGSPFLYLFLQKFAPAEVPLNLLFVTQIILASNFAANTFTMARKRYIHLALLSFISVIVVSLFSITFALLELPYYWIAFSTVLGAVAFSITTRLYLKKQVPSISAPVVSITYTRIALGVILVGNLFFQSYLFYFNSAGVLIYVLTNFKQLKEVYELVKQKVFLPQR